MIRDLVLANRSYRRFQQSHAIDMATLRVLIELAALCPSSGNLQPLRYVLSCDADKNAKIFQHVAWAGYLADWPGPTQGERPSAYVVVLGDSQACHSVNCDHGIAAQTILLGAVEKGLGGCIIGSIQREALRKALDVPDRYNILLVIALGKPAERIVLEPVTSESEIKYYRDNSGVHHVPKRSADQVILGL
ncbi:MAG: nitroreductase family protein [Planctomycetes bacterium]|nr:nitroreductase family protein [Planctomycetota bacterium]